MEEFSKSYYLTAGDTNAQGRMPMWLIGSRVIEVATLHANKLGVGYDDLIKKRSAWVLTRLSIEMMRQPQINETYTVTTWVEGFNRLFSDRCFEFTDSDGNPFGYVRSMWVAIDIDKRSAADLTTFYREDFINTERNCPVRRTGKQRPLGPEAAESEYTFRYCDIDFNRHVNTLQYIKLMLNQWPMEQFDKNVIGRFDIQFHKECRYGDTVRVRHLDSDDSRSMCEIIDPEGKYAVAAAITWNKSY